MVTKTKKEFRATEIIAFQKVGVDLECYKILKTQKKLQKKSMMRIVKDLITNNYKICNAKSVEEK